LPGKRLTRNELTGRLYRHYTFTVLPWELTTSSRRYQQKGKYRLQYHYAVIHLKKFMGAPPESLYNYFREHIMEAAEEISASGSNRE
jgi:hypothetical protein